MIKVREYAQRQLKRFLNNHEETKEEIQKALEGNYEEFCGACNYLGNEFFEKKIDYKDVRSLKDLANKIARQKCGSEFANMFDMIVKKSKQDLWCGDEFYKLFGYNIAPYYVRSCTKSALSVMRLTQNNCEDVTNVDTILQVAHIIEHPMYWTLYEKAEGYGIPDKEREEADICENKAWANINKKMFCGDTDAAFTIMQKIMKEHNERFGDGWNSIDVM
jgi:hypothetical protein